MKRIPPGPAGHPLLGSLREFRRSPLDFFTRLAHEYGDVARYRIAHHTAYLLNHPDLIESVLVTQRENFVKGRALDAARDLLGDGILLSERDAWQERRQTMQPAFHRDRVEEYGHTITSRGREMLRAWENGAEIDVHRELMSVTLRIASDALFGLTLGPEARSAGAALEIFFDGFRSEINTALLVPAWVPLPSRIRLARARRRLDELIFRQIRARRTRGKAHGDLLDLLLGACGRDGAPLTDAQIRDEVMTLFVAGHDTTALALVWSLVLLTQHPASLARLRSEVETVLAGREPRSGDVPRLRYCEMVVKEALRLYPPAWVLSRVALRDCEIGGYFVPAGTSVALSQWVTHRDGRFFPDPDEFRPERWEADADCEFARFAYFPFGGGARVCLGSTLAMTESVLLLAQIAARVTLNLVEATIPRPHPTLTLHPERGVRVRVSCDGH